MKKITLIIFLLFSFNGFANDEIKFEDYILKGNFKKEIFREDYFWSWDFRIFNNKIFLNFEGDMAGTDDPKKFPNGEYELTTENNSKIKIKAIDGIIEDFKLLSNEKDFKKYEKNISGNYCEIASFYSNYDTLYNSLNHYYYYTIPKNEVIDLMKYKNKIIACSFDYHSCISIEGNHKYILMDDTKGESKNFTKTKDNNKILSETSDILPDIIMDNCEVKYFNKTILSL